jgi:methylase of polypeptide subunit release factors
VTAELLRDLPPRHALLRDDPAALAVRLLRDREPLTEAEAALVFGDFAAPLTGAALDIVEGLYLFSAPEDVLGPSQTTAILYRAARRIAGGTVLDLGCGCGTLALLLGRAQTLGTDLNPRAIELAKFNAWANGIDGVEFREGNLYEPAVGRGFDLIVSQPPYIPLPEGQAANPYYHAGSRGDEVARAVLAGAAAHLNRGGRALVFSDWPLAERELLRDRVPHEGMRATVYASPAIVPASHFAAQAAGVRAVRQCLVVLESGAGYREFEVLPHEWAGIDIQ